jgi:Tol biopolymer transport system component
VAFESDANNLVNGDVNGYTDVFVVGRFENARRVSVGVGGAEGNGPSHFRGSGGISSDTGRYIAFTSEATNLVQGDTNGVSDVFVHDLDTRITVRVSVGAGGVQANGPSSSAVISADGRFVAFTSRATNLAPGGTAVDVFVHDRDTRITTRVSVGPGGVAGTHDSETPSLSADGRFVAFTSWADNLVPTDTTSWPDVYVHDRATGMTALVSLGPGGVQADAASLNPSISADGRYVAFSSSARNLVANDTNAVEDVFVRDLLRGVTTRESLGRGGMETNGASSAPAISADGRFVAFTSSASNLVAGDDNGIPDLFVLDRRMSALVPAADFDGDGRSDVAIYRPSTGVWFIIRSSVGTGTERQWGTPEDVPVAGDYDGDGRADIAVYRPSSGIWYIIRSSLGTGWQVQWGWPGDIPVPADYDGDRRLDIAVYRPSTGVWYILQSRSNTIVTVVWGIATDLPVPGDYDGDGRADPTVYRPDTGQWYQLRSTTGTGYDAVWGIAEDRPVAGDYDGDGRTDIAVYRPSTAVWYVIRSSTGTGWQAQWGLPFDVPVVGDYDGDRRVDPTVVRGQREWRKLRSTTGTGDAVQFWGWWADVPI